MDTRRFTKQTGQISPDKNGPVLLPSNDFQPYSYNKRRGIVISTEHIALITIFGIFFLEILNTVLRFLVGVEFIGIFINGLNWVFLIILLYWLFFKTRGKLVLKLFILTVIYMKWFVGAVYWHEYSYQKSMIVIPLYIVAIYENARFRQLLANTIRNRRNLLLGLLLLTYIPFIGSINLSGLGPYRFSAIWELPHTIAYYLLAFMLMFDRKKLLPIFVMFLLIVYTGAKSATIAAAFYMSYCILSDVTATLKGAVRIGVVLIMFAMAAYLGYFNFFFDATEHNFKPLVEREISDEAFGAGRVGLNRIAFNEIKRFSFDELLLGRSATALYRLYSGVGGKWPHNDIVTSMFVYGLLGLGFYIYHLFIFPLRRSKHKLPVMALMCVVLLLMVTNGFYTYLSHLLYVAIFALLYQEEIEAKEKKATTLKEVEQSKAD